MTRRHLVAAIVAALASGCAPTTMYRWGGYDDALYQHYRNPQDHEALVVSLRTTVADAESHGVRVPPGICAELGYALFEEGKPQEAVPWFEREQKEWPESAAFMQKMIRNAKVKAAQPQAPATGPAAATEAYRS